MGETLGREIAAHFSLSGNRPTASPVATHSAVLSTDTFLWRRLGSFHGDLIRWLGCTRRQIWS